MLRDCKYRLPCGSCDKYDRDCEALQLEIFKQEQNECQNVCKHNWVLEEQEIIKQKVSYKRYKCSTCGEEQITRTEVRNGEFYETLWKRY